MYRHLQAKVLELGSNEGRISIPSVIVTRKAPTPIQEVQILALEAENG